jgi:WD40 repeat protein
MQCGNIGTLQWSPDGSLLAAGARNGTLVLWNTESQQMQMDVPVSSKERIYSLAWFPDSTLIAVAYRSGRVVFWDARAKREMKIWKGFPGPPLMLSILLDPLTLTIATENSLLFGSPGEQAPSMYCSGQLLAVWSTKSKLATLDEYNDTTLIIWQR